MENIFASFGAFIQSILDWHKNLILSILDAFFPKAAE